MAASMAPHPSPVGLLLESNWGQKRSLRLVSLCCEDCL